MTRIVGVSAVIHQLFAYMRGGNYDANYITDAILTWRTESGERRLITAMLYELSVTDASHSQSDLPRFFGLLARKRPTLFASLIGMVEHIICNKL